MMEAVNLALNISEIFESRYVIPLYQRNFAWREEEIKRLLTDVWEAYNRNPHSNYYIGSLVVCKRVEGSYEVIDGQQRLTVLSLITKQLGLVKRRMLSYDSRPHVEQYLDALYSGANASSHPTTLYLEEAVDTINEANLNERVQGEENYTIHKAGREFAEYFANNVILVRVELPEDTDMATYFEIMNNRGEQLREHEILKSLMMSELEESKQAEFAAIWDACSQMDDHIHEKFDAALRRRYFGEDLGSFRFDGLSSGNDSLAVRNDPKTIDQIISQGYREPELKPDGQSDKLEAPEEEFLTSIIDFPNFLMHIFRAFFNQEYKAGHKDNDVPLDAKYLLSVYADLMSGKTPDDRKRFSEEFIAKLFQSKVYFDAYVVKVFNMPYKTDDDSIRWSLKRVAWDNDHSKMYLKLTFSGNDSTQARAVKALSMLQVTYRNRRYKNWLLKVVELFDDYRKQSEKVLIPGDKYIDCLEKYMLERYGDFIGKNEPREIMGDVSLKKDNSLSLGTDTPHFLLNFIDYLYWVESKVRSNDILQIPNVRDFDFKYWNSVEHHLSRKKAEHLPNSGDYVDNLGNLCLLSKSANSRLSDRDVKEKVEVYGKGNMGPKRQIMYAMTESNGYNWGHDEIRQHYNDLVLLLSKREEILKKGS
jgi:hypothetical protein